MTKLNLMLAAVVLGGSAPAVASAAAPAPAKPAAAKPAAAKQALTRAALQKQTDETFKAVDTNGDGVLTAQEVGAAELKILQQRAGVARSRLDAEFGKLDTNHDNQLSKAEFMAAAPAGPTAAPNGAPVVTQLDKNKDGKVSLDEYRAPRLAVFDRADTNHDGTISAAEQQALAKSRR